MSWLYESRTVRSAKNGAIRLRRTWGRWEAFVGAAHESSRYTDRMWENAAERLPASFDAKRVLMIGLGLGRTADLWRKRFPDSVFVAIEWDPVMIRLARECRGSSANDSPSVILGDAGAILPQLRGSYDLILVDAFVGQDVSRPATNDAAARELARLLSAEGLLIANVYLEPSRLASLDRSFEKTQDWNHEFNRLALYATRTKEYAK